MHYPPAQGKKYLASVIIVSLFLIFSTLVSPPPVAAYFQQEQFYDWGVSHRDADPQVLGLRAFAQEEVSPKLDIPTILPDNLLYFAKTSFEAVQLALTFNDQAKADRKLGRAEKRLAEAKALIDKGKVDRGTAHLKKYQAQLDDATRDLASLKEKGRDVKDLAQKVEQATAKHTTILENVALRLPEAAMPGIENAIDVSQTGMDRAADALGEPPMPVDLLARMNALRGQGILTEEETATLIQVKSREEARKAFRNLMEAGVVPEADFKRLDSGQARYFGQEFVKSVEIHKFHELRRFEQDKPDEETQRKLERFARSFRPGDIVPPELRRHWAATVRLEEIQKTIRPDLIRIEHFAGRADDFARLQELQDRVRPTAEEARRAEEFLHRNPDQPVPPEIQRVLDLKERLGIVAEGYRPPPGHAEATFLPPNLFKFEEVPLQTGFQGEFPPPEKGPEPQYQPEGEFRTPYYPAEGEPPIPYHQEKPGEYVPPPPSDLPPPSPESCPPGSYWDGATCHFPPSEGGGEPPPPPPPGGEEPPPPPPPEGEGPPPEEPPPPPPE